MKLNKMAKAMITAVTLSVLVSVPAMADWQYTLYGPIAVWTNTVTGEQTTVFAGQPAPDGTAAPDLTLTSQSTTETGDVNSAIEAANAAVEAANAARGGSTSDVLTDAQLKANTEAANLNQNTNMVTVINGSSSNSGSVISNADLPMIATSDQSEANSSGLSDGSYVGPGNSTTSKISGKTGVTTENTSYVAKDGHIVTNAQSPDVSTTDTTSSDTSTTGTKAPSVPTSSGSGTSSATTGNTVTNYDGTLPSTGAGNVNTYSSPGT